MKLGKGGIDDVLDGRKSGSLIVLEKKLLLAKFSAFLPEKILAGHCNCHCVMFLQIW